ncbi:MAG: translation initiation factor IF-2 subunit gamma [Candidatus Aenigmarchaeota archaeon]|nr:translation initiation factor IF-2 subunit gamma [Candidatus Aenigmarchaeota archaeon]
MTKLTNGTLLPEVNIGLVGHVDHGKTSLTQSLTGKWTDTHSEEIKRGISIRLGYADATFYYCEKCKSYGIVKSASNIRCMKCLENAKPTRSVSFVDAPGHETLMATMLSGACLMDGAVLVIAADEKCPQPQTAEHLKALDIVGIKNIVIVQNKIDIVSEEQAMENYNQIKSFVKGTVAENAPVIPISAIHNINIDSLVEAIETTIPTPERNKDAIPKFYVARSFDVNKPGTPIEELRGGVIGGSITQGKIGLNGEIQILPGVKKGNGWEPLKTKVVEIIQAGQQLEEAEPGGLVALQTKLDPALARSDGLSGSLAGSSLPAPLDNITMNVSTFNYVIGVQGTQKIPSIQVSDPLLLTVAIAKTVGIVTSVKKSKKDNAIKIETKLKLPVVAEKNERIAISKQISGRWHLIGHGTIV